MYRSKDIPTPILPTSSGFVWMPLRKGHHSSEKWSPREAPVPGLSDEELSSPVTMLVNICSLSTVTVHVGNKERWNPHHMTVFKAHLCPAHQRWNISEYMANEEEEEKKLYFWGLEREGETGRRILLENGWRHPFILKGRRVSNIPES